MGFQKPTCFSRSLSVTHVVVTWPFSYPRGCHVAFKLHTWLSRVIRFSHQLPRNCRAVSYRRFSSRWTALRSPNSLNLSQLKEKQEDKLLESIQILTDLVTKLLNHGCPLSRIAHRSYVVSNYSSYAVWPQESRGGIFKSWDGLTFGLTGLKGQPILSLSYFASTRFLLFFSRISRFF